MRRSFVATLILMLAAAAAAIPFGVSALEAVTAIDGDTLEISGTTYRLFGIDAPERYQTCTVLEKPWACGGQARDALTGLTAGRAVECTPAGIDDTGYATARCRANGRDLAAVMVQFGWALAVRAEAPEYLAIEQQASKDRAGIWRGDFVLPSVFRRIVNTAAK